MEVNRVEHTEVSADSSLQRN